jgi:hypothetical protein
MKRRPLDFASTALIARRWPSIGVGGLSRRLGAIGFCATIFSINSIQVIVFYQYTAQRQSTARQGGRRFMMNQEQADRKAARRRMWPGEIRSSGGASPRRGGVFGLFLGPQPTYNGRSDVQCARRLIQLDGKPFQGIVEIQFG